MFRSFYLVILQSLVWQRASRNWKPVCLAKYIKIYLNNQNSKYWFLLGLEYRHQSKNMNLLQLSNWIQTHLYIMCANKYYITYPNCFFFFMIVTRRCWKVLIPNHFSHISILRFDHWNLGSVFGWEFFSTLLISVKSNPLKFHQYLSGFNRQKFLLEFEMRNFHCNMPCCSNQHAYVRCYTHNVLDIVASSLFQRLKKAGG